MTADGTTGAADERPAVALVAGGSRGLGLLIARELGRRGYAVLLCARTESEVHAAAAMLRAEGHDTRSAVCDVGDADAVQSLVERTEAEWGPIEVSICVAGIIQVGPLAALRRSHFEEAVAIMLWGPVNVALAVIAPMRGRGRGRIGIVTSVGGLISAPHLLPYSTAKFGAVGFSRGLRSELSGTGITVTTIAPGLMRTGSHVRARFLGDVGAEYSWFAAAASLPLLSMDADRAARRMVDAVLAGRSVLTLTPLAKLAPKADALFPRTASVVLAATARLLPAAPTEAVRDAVPGHEAARGLPGRWRWLLGRLTVLGSRAARRNNELATPSRPDPVAAD